VSADLTAGAPWPRVVPTTRLAAAVAILAPLWLVPGDRAAWLALGAAGVLALLVVVDWVGLPAARDLALERELPATVGVGDLVEGRLRLRSRWGRTLHAVVADELPDAAGGASPPRAVVLPARGAVEVPVALTGRRRGRHALGRVAVRLRSWLGLLATRVRFHDESTILVAPSVAGVSRYRLLALQHRLHEAGVRVLRQRGEGTSFAGLRDYAVGDDPRRVDWKATARRRKLIVREHEVEQSQVVLALVDAGRSMTQLAGEFSRFEHTLSSVLVLADVAGQSGDRVGALVFDDRVRAYVPPQRGASALRAIREALVPVEASLEEPDYGGAFRALAARQRRRALVVFFTDVIDARSSRALIAYVGRSAARHLVLVVALRNDALLAAAQPAADRASALFEAAAAEELIAARAEALERMRRSGVAVLDVSPQSMTAAVVNRYLELKSRGAI